MKPVSKLTIFTSTRALCLSGTVVTPSQWTADDDFTSADLLLPHLGDDDRPLQGIAAEQAGGAVLSVASLRAIHAERQSRPRRTG